MIWRRNKRSRLKFSSNTVGDVLVEAALRRLEPVPLHTPLDTMQLREDGSWVLYNAENPEARLEVIDKKFYLTGTVFCTEDDSFQEEEL